MPSEPYNPVGEDKPVVEDEPMGEDEPMEEEHIQEKENYGLEDFWNEHSVALESSNVQIIIIDFCCCSILKHIIL